MVGSVCLWRILRTCIAVGLSVAGVVLSPTPACAHVPVPDSVLNPQSAPEAWNVLRLASANLERLVREDRLAEVPDQASLCGPALRTLARLAEGTPARQSTAMGTVRAASAVDSLAQACIAGDRGSIEAALRKLHAALHLLAEGQDQRTVNADIFFCAMHPDVLSVDGQALCPKCGMALTPRRIPYSFVYAAPPGEPSMVLTTETDMPPTAGRPLQIKLRLVKKDGTPVSPADLLVAHTQRIHLLIIDPTMEDYHHEHPTPTDNPGEYHCTFIPAKTSTYRIFADVVPSATGIQEYIVADLKGMSPGAWGGPTTIQRATTFDSDAGGLHFRLSHGTADGVAVHAQTTQLLTVSVRERDGRPVERLEPVMNAFAHLVGFYEDGCTVIHSHPQGAEVEDAALRGGPSLEFRLYPPKSGFVRLFCQVCVDGKMIFAPFDLVIVP